MASSYTREPDCTPWERAIPVKGFPQAVGLVRWHGQLLHTRARPHPWERAMPVKGFPQAVGLVRWHGQLLHTRARPHPWERAMPV